MVPHCRQRRTLGYGGSRSLKTIGTIGGKGSSPPFHSGMQKPWSSVRWCDTDGSKSRSIAVCRMWLASFGCPEIFLKGQSFIHGSAGPSCSSPIPMQMPGRLSMKKFTQWSGAISTSTSGRAALMRRPSSVSARLRSCWSAGLTSFQPRMISGAWLEANTPASLAMARPRRGGGPGGSHFSQEFRFGHSGNHEVEAQKVGVDPRGEERDVVALDRGAHFGLQGIAVENLLPAGAVFLAERSGTLKIEEELAQPVVSHIRYFAMSVGACNPRTRLFSLAFCSISRSSSSWFPYFTRYFWRSSFWYWYSMAKTLSTRARYE